jgi:hypothetical protein
MHTKEILFDFFNILNWVKKLFFLISQNATSTDNGACVAGDAGTSGLACFLLEISK